MSDLTPALPPSPDPLWKSLDPRSKFEALKMRFEQQTELLRHMRQTDLTIVTGFLTLQAIAAGFLLRYPVPPGHATLGAMLFDLSLLGCVMFVLYQNFIRRTAEIAKLRTVREALGFYEPGVYLPDKAIEERRTQTFARNWFAGFVLASLASTIALLIVALTS